jgi:hypothetical protein
MKAKTLPQGLNLRQQPTTESKVVTILKKSWVLDVIEPDTNGWTKVQYGIYQGFVSSKFIDVLPDVQQPIMTLSERALNVAVYQLGNAEVPHGSNWGPAVEKYLKSVGINSPSAWCMGFVYWCVNEACKEMDLNNPLKKTGGVMAQWVASKHLRVDKPMKGDIFIMDFGGGKGHTGFVTQVIGDRIQTVEGNSNDEGSREGFEVCRKPGGRAISSCKGFLRLVNN